LQELRDALLEQSGRLVREAHEEAVGYSMHMADSGTDSFDRDFALSLLSADQNALAEIEAAIQRIQRGQYGRCEMTGRPIAAARLEAIPWTRFSYEAQQQVEKSGLKTRMHLGSLRSVHGTESAEPDEPEEEAGGKPEPST
jgi:RNA polymerase-binding transcription factor DksA